MLITFAYQIQGYQLVGGPDWINGERYDIVAKMEGDPPAVIPGPGADHMMLATRTLLADRFKLKIHKETRELDIYALTMAKAGGKPGPKLIPARGGCSPEELAADWQLEFELEFQPEVQPGQLPPGAASPPIDPDAPSFFTAIQEQLGLKLDASKGPVEVWVIDSIERPTPD